METNIQNEIELKENSRNLSDIYIGKLFSWNYCEYIKKKKKKNSRHSNKLKNYYLKLNF